MNRLVMLTVLLQMVLSVVTGCMLGGVLGYFLAGLTVLILATGLVLFGAVCVLQIKKEEGSK